MIHIVWMKFLLKKWEHDTLSHDLHPSRLKTGLCSFIRETISMTTWTLTSFEQGATRFVTKPWCKEFHGLNLFAKYDKQWTPRIYSHPELLGTPGMFYIYLFWYSHNVKSLVLQYNLTHIRICRKVIESFKLCQEYLYFMCQKNIIKISLPLRQLQYFIVQWQH